MKALWLLAAGALGFAGLLSACSSPVRLATPAETRQATAQQASPAPAAGSTGSGSGTAPSPGASASPAPSTGSGALGQLQNEFRQLVARITPSVVQIDTGSGLGSGVILSATGDIVTNAHVVDGAPSLTVTTSDGHAYKASTVGSYPSNDLAVIRASGAVGLTPATFGDSTKVQIGDIVMAVGSPLGLTESVSEGIVSGIGRSQPEGNGVTLTNLIQITAAINPGNSGGALIDITGQVIGIPTLGAGSGNRAGTASGIGFAIPSSQVQNVTKQLASGGAVTHSNLPYLGVTTANGTAGGALVSSVVSGGPADQAGVKTGWVLTSLGGHSIADSSAVGQILAGYKPGDRVDLIAQLPDGSKRTVTLTIGERPATP